MGQKYFKFGTGRNILKDDRGVSPVIAVILMVAITVVMAAIVSSWSAGIKAPTAPTTVGLDISRNSNNVTIVVTSIDPASSAPIPVLNISYYNYSTGTFYLNYTTMTDADVGALKVVSTYSSTIKQMIITATYKDSSKKVLFSREI